MVTSLTVNDVARRLSATLADTPDSPWVDSLSRAFAEEPDKLPEILDAARRAAPTDRRRGSPRYMALLSMLVYSLETLAHAERGGHPGDPGLPETVRARAVEIVRDKRVSLRQAAMLVSQIGHARFAPGPELERAITQRLAGRFDEVGAIMPGFQGTRAPEAFVDDMVAGHADDVAGLATEFAGGTLAFPSDVRINAARAALKVNRPIARAAALVWLTDEDPRVRAQVSEAVHETAAAGRLDPASVRRLETLARWAPDADSTRMRAAAAAARTAGVAAEDPGPGTLRSAHVTGIDGSGLALMVLETRRRSAWGLAVLSLQEHRGVPTAWQRPVGQRRDVDAVREDLGRDGDLYTVGEDVVRAFLAQRLAEGRAADRLPAFALVDIAAAAGFSDLAPAFVDGRVRQAELAAGATGSTPAADARATALRRSAHWPAENTSVARWAVPLTEVGPHLDTLMSRDPAPAVDAIGERYRTVWADRLTWLASFDRAHNGDSAGAWRDYTELAGALYDAGPMSAIPLAHRLIVDPVTAAADRLDREDDADAGA